MNDKIKTKSSLSAHLQIRKTRNKCQCFVLYVCLIILLDSGGFKTTTVSTTRFTEAFPFSFPSSAYRSFPIGCFSPFESLQSCKNLRSPSSHKMVRNSCKSNNDNDDNLNEDDPNRLFRLSFLGASVSPHGFIALLSTSSNIQNGGSSMILPIRISSTSTDEFTASSLEALTFLQLLAGVDMASEGVLPIQILQHIIALDCCSLENNENRENESNVNHKAKQIMANALSDIHYATATQWQRVRVKFPKVGLNEVRIIPMEDDSGMSSSSNTQTSLSSNPYHSNVSFILDCTIEGFPLSIQLSHEIIQDIHSSLSSTDGMDSMTRVAFYSLSLALRYKVPISVSSESLNALSSLMLTNNKNGNNLMDSTGPDDNNIQATPLLQAYPKWKSATSLQFQSSRVVKTIERGFEVHRLDGALEIAIEKGDKIAEAKIREKMKEYERLDDLPVANDMETDQIVLDGDDYWA